MKFKELPESVQVVAANVLAAKIRQDDESGIVKPASNELAAGVRDAFCELYSEAKTATSTMTVNFAGAHKPSPVNEKRHASWEAVISAARQAQSAGATDFSGEYEIDLKSVIAILNAFDELGFIPTFPDMLYELNIQCGELSKKGEIVNLSPPSVLTSGIVRAVFVGPHSPVVNSK